MVTKPIHTIETYGVTHAGCVRDSNEDAFVVYQIDEAAAPGPAEAALLSTGGSGVLLMVCDGMGGAAAGEVASALAVETTCRALSENRAEPDLASAFLAANEAIYNESQRRADARGMGTTATAALARGDQLIVAQVGDSRAYLFRGAELEQLTRDQSLGMAMVDSGIISLEKLKNYPRANVILQALGAEEIVAPVVTQRQLAPRDIVLLCSDGLHGYVDEEQILSILRGSDQLSDRALALIQAALDAGAPDNVTVILARLNG